MSNSCADILTKDFLQENYVLLKKTITQISAELGISNITVSKYLKLNHIEIKQPTKLKYENKQFGCITVLYRNPQNQVEYTCRCRCGHVYNLLATAITDRKYCPGCEGEYKSKNQRGGYAEITGQVFGDIRQSAKQRNLEFNITIEYIWQLFLKQERKCSLTDVELKFNKNKKELKLKTASLDRIDNTKGYIEGNVQWVHKDINQMKWMFHQSCFIQNCSNVANKSGLSCSIYEMIESCNDGVAAFEIIKQYREDLAKCSTERREFKWLSQSLERKITAMSKEIDSLKAENATLRAEARKST